MNNLETEQEFALYLNGKKLYGDDFSLSEIEKWYQDEIEGYANLGSKDRDKYVYPYHNRNILYGFNYLPKNNKFHNALGFGSAYGEEFLPIIEKILKLSIVEPSDNLVSEYLGGIKPKYVKPQTDGTLIFEDNQFDLILCLSALHHIPNVSHVISEMVRVLQPGGYLLIHEPIRSMGDWRKTRVGLTQNERGIPHKFLDNIFINLNLKVIKKSFCDCAFAWIILNKLIGVKKNTISYQKFDRFLAKLLQWNIHYNSEKLIYKCAPASVYFVLQKPKTNY